MTSGEECWEENYASRGPLWGGAVHLLPDLPNRARVLELGCGNGKTLSAMRSRGWNVTGIDISPRALQLARHASPGEPEITLAVADIRQLPFCAGSFDAVCAFHVLGHISTLDRASALQEISRVTRAGGQVFFRDFSTRDFRYGQGKETGPGTFLRGNGIQTHYFTGREVVDLFTGFVAESTGTCSWLMRVKGMEYVRSEITGIFAKKS
ncbi:class I SAM-dependent methyltransferase [Methanoregula sp.]|uniref:class I SAM-dependent methyltransferase n=1 Tax=Methanoregula sp. TaxID=2052170 RepID=UPI003C71C73D